MKLFRCMTTLLALALAQSAAAATFNFSGLGSVPATGYSSTVDDITVTVSTPEGNKLGYYTLVSLGEGMGHSGCVFFICSAGIQQNESLVISFSQAVTVNSVTFAAWDGPDTAKLVASNGNELTLDADPTFGQVDSFTLSALGPLSSFSITDTSFTGLFTLRGLDVSPVAAVPVPASVWLFGSALLGLSARRRAQK